MALPTFEDRVDPVDGAALATCAGSFLYGDALLIGLGRARALRAAQLAVTTRSIDVVERDKNFKAYLPFNPTIRTFWMDISDFVPTKKYESIFLDAFPQVVGIPEKCYDWLVEIGRVIFIDSVYPRELFGEGWKEYASIRPGYPDGSSERLVVLMKDILNVR